MPAQTDDLKTTLSRLSQTQIEAIWLGALLTARLANDENAEAARQIIAALEVIRASTIDSKVMVLDLEASDNTATSQALPHDLDIHALRQALIHELKLGVAYIDAKGRATKRTVWPLDVQDLAQTEPCWHFARNGRISGTSGSTGSQSWQSSSSDLKRHES